MQHQETMQQIAAVSEKVGYAGAGGAFLFGLSAAEFAAIAGLIVAVLGMLISNSINWYYKHKAHKLLEKEYATRGIVEDEE
jgi:hypothetical protein